MPKRKAAVKRLRVDKKRHLRNLGAKKDLKKALKKFQALISTKNIDESKKMLSEISSLLDKAAKKRIIHPRTADRKKSRLAQRVLRAA
jgi:small subunit ribosomal protein S20